MKKIVLLLLLSCSVSLYAQQFRYGVSIGFSKNSLVYDPSLYDEDGPVFSGFQYGLLFNQTFMKSELLGITAGFNLNYAESGLTSTNISGSNSDKEWTVRARYIEIPITLQARTPQLGKFVFYAEGGFAYGKCSRAMGDYWETKANGELEGDSDLDYFDRGSANSVEYLKTNYGLQFGFGTEFEISEGATLLIGAFMQRGATSVYSDNNDGSEVKLNQTGIRIAGLF